MSASDEFCGCGDYECRACFWGSAPRPTGNAWLDLAYLVFPNSRSMSREERKEFTASFWPKLDEAEPIIFTDYDV